MKIHFIKAGETLYEISKKYGVTVEEIMAANTSVTDPNIIMAGMKLIIPVKKLQVPIPVDSIAPSSPHFPLDLNSSHIPVYPEQALSQSTPQSIPQLIPQLTPQLTPQPIPQAPTGIVNQGFSYPSQAVPPFGQAVPPFAAIPVPAQQVTAPGSMSSVPVWTMPTGYTPYNTPYHMTNYTIPNSFPNPTFQGMPEVTSNYQPYSPSIMQFPNNKDYEYYSTYSALQSNAEWPSHNPQPHGQFNQPQTTQDIPQTLQSKQQDDNEEKPSVSSSNLRAHNTEQQERKKARTSSTSKESVPVKKNSLHDQVMRLQQRNKTNQR